MSDTEYAPPPDEVASAAGIAARVNAAGAAAPAQPAPAPSLEPPAAALPEGTVAVSREEWEELVATNRMLVDDLYGPDVDYEPDDAALYDEPSDPYLGIEAPIIGPEDPRIAALAGIVKKHTAEHIGRMDLARGDEEAWSIVDEAKHAFQIADDKFDGQQVRERATVLLGEITERRGLRRPNASCAREALIAAVVELKPAKDEMAVAQRASMKAGLLARLEGR